MNFNFYQLYYAHFIKSVNFVSVLIIYWNAFFAAVRAQPALPRTVMVGMRHPRRRAAEFGRARMAEPGPQGPQRFLR
jgi:hypothetical protein